MTDPTAAVARPRPGPQDSAGAAPPRRPDSVRRTSSIDVTWPDGLSGMLHLSGRARDIATDAAGGLLPRGEDAFTAVLDGDRTIHALETTPPRAGAARLVGERGGGHLRRVLDAVLPDERLGATPLHLLLDDISGASLVAPWAFSQWSPEWLEMLMARAGADDAARIARMEGVCTGFAPGSSALDPNRGPGPSGAPTPDLRREDDPDGWHAWPESIGVSLRRARRIDVMRDADGMIRVDSAFQDSAPRADGSRAVLHEYRLSARIDAVGRLVDIEAEPRVLPFPECPAAARNLTRLIGTPAAALRETVLTQLRGTAGCTHLNDAVRALAEVPALVARLPG